MPPTVVGARLRAGSAGGAQAEPEPVTPSCASAPSCPARPREAARDACGAREGLSARFLAAGNELRSGLSDPRHEERGRGLLAVGRARGKDPAGYVHRSRAFGPWPLPSRLRGGTEGQRDGGDGGDAPQPSSRPRCLRAAPKSLRSCVGDSARSGLNRVGTLVRPRAGPAGPGTRRRPLLASSGVVLRVIARWDWYYC